MLIWESGDFHGALPYPGSLLDQPAGLVRRMRKAKQVWQVFDAFRRAKSWERFQVDNPDAWDLKCAVDRLRSELSERLETSPDD